MNGCSKMASIWFGDSERTSATSICALALPVGCIIGFAIGPVYVHPSDAKPENHSIGKDHVMDYMLTLAIMATVGSAPMLFLYKQKPDKFPSESAEEYAMMFTQEGNKGLDFKGETKALCLNRNYIWLSITFCL